MRVGVNVYEWDVWHRKAFTQSTSWHKGFAKAAGNHQLKITPVSHRGIRTGWQTCSCGTEALKWLPVTWKILARLRLVLSSLKFQTNFNFQDIHSPLSFLHEERRPMLSVKNHTCADWKLTHAHTELSFSVFICFSGGSKTKHAR